MMNDMHCETACYKDAICVADKDKAAAFCKYAVETNSKTNATCHAIGDDSRQSSPESANNA